MFGAGVLNWHLYRFLAEPLQVDHIACGPENLYLVVLQDLKYPWVHLETQLRVLPRQPVDHALEYPHRHPELLLQAGVVLLESPPGNGSLHRLFDPAAGEAH